jgi:pyruvate,water dikinase
MAPAEAAGVAFSLNPVTGDTGEIVVSAVRGLGDRLMSGEATADEWVVRGDEVGQSSGTEQAVKPDEVRQVAALAAAVAEHFGAAQDIEWAIVEGQVWLLQARPITGLREGDVPQVPIEIEVPAGFSTRDRNIDRPWVPLQRSVFLPAFSAGARHVFAYTTGMVPTACVIGGWTYVTTPPDNIRALIERLERIAATVAAGDPQALVHTWNREWKPQFAARIAELRDVDLAGLTGEALAAHVDAVRRLFTDVHDRYFRLTGASIVLLGELGVTCGELLGWDAAQTLRLRGGLTGDHVPATARLGDLARMAAARPRVRELLEAGAEVDEPARRLAEVDPEFADAFADYVRAYGHRTIGFDVTEPTLAQQPTVLLQLVRAQLDDPYDFAAERAALDARRSAALGEARAALAQRTTQERERFEAAVAGSALSGPVRDEKVFYAVSVWALLRYAALELGTRLVAAGALEQVDDVFFLDLADALALLRDPAPQRDLVRQRRGEYAWAVAHPGPPFYGQPPAPMVPEPDMAQPSAGAQQAMQVAQWSMSLFVARPAEAAQDGALRGVAASAGRYVGPARVIDNVTEFGKLRRGDVLVCPETTAQWAVLFPSIGALVTDRGSLLSHPAIIAREYGVPAVVATGTATTTFRDDQLLVVDGTAGVVRPATDR